MEIVVGINVEVHLPLSCERGGSLLPLSRMCKELCRGISTTEGGGGSFEVLDKEVEGEETYFVHGPSGQEVAPSGTTRQLHPQSSERDKRCVNSTSPLHRGYYLDFLEVA